MPQPTRTAKSERSEEVEQRSGQTRPSESTATTGGRAASEASDQTRPSAVRRETTAMMRRLSEMDLSPPAGRNRSMEISREQVLRYRVHAQQLDRDESGDASTAAHVLDLGVQDTGPDGARWALEVRGFAPDPGELFTAWTLRGAPHVYRRDPGRGRRCCGGPALGGRCGQADLHRGPSVEAGGHPGARGPRPDRRGDALDRHHPDRQGRPVQRAACPAAGAVPALLPGVRRGPPLRAAVPFLRAAGRARAAARHLAAGPRADPRLARTGEGRRPRTGPDPGGAPPARAR